MVEIKDRFRLRSSSQGICYGSLGIAGEAHSASGLEGRIT
jgi:hypothetical protein